MLAFVIVADVRTGSTLLSSSLNQHPQIRCYGELLHTQDFPDNQLETLDRHHLDGQALVQAAFATPAAAVGFRAMTFTPLPERVQWDSAWDALRAWPNLHVIYLTRQNQLAQYASWCIAQQTGVFHPHDNDQLYQPEHRPQIVIDPAALRAWVAERQQLLQQRQQQLAAHTALALTYEQLTGAWEPTMRQIQAFLHVQHVPLPQSKRKQERRPLSQVIANYAELAAAGLAEQAAEV